MQRGNIVSTSEPVWKEGTSRFRMITIISSHSTRFLGDRGCCLQMVPVYLTSRQSITGARSEKSFRTTVANGSVKKLQAASPHPPETKPVGAFLPFFTLKLLLSIRWIKKTKQLLRESEMFLLETLSWKEWNKRTYFYQSGAVAWDPGWDPSTSWY